MYTGETLCAFVQCTGSGEANYLSQIDIAGQMANRNAGCGLGRQGSFSVPSGLVLGVLRDICVFRMRRCGGARH